MSLEPEVPASEPHALSGLTNRTWWSAVLYITAAAILLRFVDLPLKPLHHDEAVNTLFLTNLARPPHLYKYDAANYHGPTLYYLGWLSTSVFGLTTVAIRMVTAIAGLATVLLLFGLRGHIGGAGALAAAALLCVSPGAVYFSRYFIHESLLVGATLATCLAAAVWFSGGGRKYAIFAAAAAGFMFATKETALIAAVVLIGAGLAATLLPRFRSASPAGRCRIRLLDCMPAPSGSWRHLLVVAASCVAVFVAVNLLFYTSLLSNPQGALDALKAYAIWTKTGTTDHVRSWDTYLRWLAQQELALLIVGTTGALAALWRAENRFAVFAAVWTIGILAAYSVIPYKTPWLTLNIVLPLAICGGYACELIWRHRHAVPGPVAAGAAAALVALAGYQAVVLNFARYDDERSPYVYVHTYRDLFALLNQVHRLSDGSPNVTIAVTSREQFPLSWYLRDYRAGYYGKPVATGDALVIASEDQTPILDISLGDRYDQVGTYRLRPGVNLVLYARRDLRRGA